MSEPIQSIAQNNYILHNIDAKKLYVQEPLFTANSGDAVYVGWRPDETVLYSGAQTFSATLSESVKNFDKVLIEYGPNNYFNAPVATFFTDKFADNNAGSGVHLEFVEHNGTAAYCFPKTTTFVWHNNFTHLDAIGGLQYRVSGNAIQSEATGNQIYIQRIIGINRKENA